MKITAAKLKEMVRASVKKHLLAEGTGGMSSASMGGPVLAESDDESRGYDKAMQEVTELINEQIKTYTDVGDQASVHALEALKRLIAGVSQSAKTQQHLTRATRRGLPPVKV